MSHSLTPLQRSILRLLAPLFTEPGWVLSGGAALIGFHTGHRVTRDIDLFLRAEQDLGDAPARIAGDLQRAGLSVSPLQRTPAFVRLLVADDGEQVVLDLIAEPVPEIEPPEERSLDGFSLRVDTAHELLVNKLCTLLSRSEVRDLQDVRALLDGGGDLPRALGDGAMKDGAFSALTLAWVLRELPVLALAGTAGIPATDAERLAQFRDDLVDRITALALPADDEA